MTEIIKISRSAHGSKFHFCFPTRIWQAVLMTGTERIKNNLEIWHRCTAFLPQCAECVPLQLGMLKYDYTVLKLNKFIYISVRELKSIAIIVLDTSDEKTAIKIKGKTDENLQLHRWRPWVWCLKTNELLLKSVREPKFEKAEIRMVCPHFPPYDTDWHQPMFWHPVKCNIKVITCVKYTYCMNTYCT